MKVTHSQKMSPNQLIEWITTEKRGLEMDQKGPLAVTREIFYKISSELPSRA